MNLTDVNDNAPQFESSQPVDVEENRGGGSLITTIRATDADQGVNAAISYTIVGGDPFGMSIAMRMYYLCMEKLYVFSLLIISLTQCIFRTI